MDNTQEIYHQFIEAQIDLLEKLRDCIQIHESQIKTCLINIEMMAQRIQNLEDAKDI